jgi:hypothetical protein
MGRTIPTATMLLRMEQHAWKPFRNALDKSVRKAFDEMLSLSHMFNYAQMCAIPSHPVAIQPIFMSIVFMHYKELTRMMAQD